MILVNWLQVRVLTPMFYDTVGNWDNMLHIALTYTESKIKNENSSKQYIEKQKTSKLELLSQN